MPFRAAEKKKRRFSFIARLSTYVAAFGGNFPSRFSFGTTLGLAVTLGLMGCANNPQARLERHCPSCTFIEITIPGELSPLSAVSQIRDQDRGRLHIYLEGDGRPWSQRNTPALDPNSRRLTALQLMQQDETSSIYLNRPCYGLAAMPKGCDLHLWTANRYSEAVVAALNDGLEQIKRRHGDKELVLIGHSGGGTLAMLLAQRRTDVAAVITLAANLDQHAWTEHFNYLPLSGSLNAIDVELPPHIHRWHFAAGLDQQVPAILIKHAVAQDRYARMHMVENFDHACCWADIWPSVLQELHKQLEKDAASPRTLNDA